VHGDRREHLHETTGDFIIARADNIPGYQLAVVLDDIAMGITHVLRGDDLLSSTPRQLLLFDAFGAPRPAYAHVPLILGPDNVRLAKRHGSVSIAELREAGHSPDEVIGWLAWSCGLRGLNEPCRPIDLIADFSLDAIHREPTRLQRLGID
jgi:glutamyl-tRNA synthetase